GANVSEPDACSPLRVEALVRAGETTRATLVVPRKRPISGIVTSGGRPIEGAAVSAGASAEVTTDPDGRFTLEYCPWQKDVWSAKAPGYLSRVEDLAPGTTDLRIELEPCPAIRVHARFLD